MPQNILKRSTTTPRRLADKKTFAGTVDNKTKILIEIQYLRAVAILMVVLGHSSLLHELIPLSLYFNGTAAVGVDLFFVISGYVISKSLIPTLTIHEGFVENIEKKY